MTQTADSKLVRLLSSPALVDFISIVFLSLGLYSTFLCITYWEIAPAAYISMILLSLLCIYFFSIRWWLAPSFLLAAGAILVVYLWVQDAWLEFADAAYSYIQWILQGVPTSELYKENGLQLAFEIVVAFLITLGVFLFIKKLFSFTLLFVLHAAFYLLVMASWTKLDYSHCVLLSAAGLIILLPRLYAKHADRLQKKNKGETAGRIHLKQRRAHMQFIALPLSILIVLLSQLIVPTDTKAWKSKGLNLFAEDLITLTSGQFEGEGSRYRSNFNLGTLGFQAEPSRLGGPVALSDEIMLAVTSPLAALLKGSVYDEYTGSLWTVGSRNDGDYRYLSSFWDDNKEKAFDRDKSFAGGEAKMLYESLTNELSVMVEYRTNRYTSVFTANRTSDFTFVNRGFNDQVYFNMRSELYLRARLPVGTNYIIYTDVWRSRGDSFNLSFLRLEELMSAADDPMLERITEQYTQLPESLPQSVHDMAASITEDAETPYEKAIALEQWLALNCTYTLSPPMPPEDRDFVDYFLETRYGYCTYYASAMAVMARSVGVPSRYVTGFALESAQGSTGSTANFLATGKTAHAWTELYFQGIGWVDFDPLRWTPYYPLNQNQEETIAFDITPSPSPTAPPATPTPDPQAQDIQNDGSQRQGINFWLIATLVFLFILCIIAAYRIIRKRKILGYQLNRVRRIRRSTTEQYQYYIRDILKQLAVLGITSMPGETLLTFAARVDRRIIHPGINFEKIAGIQLLAIFAEIPPGQDQVKEAYKYHKLTEEYLQRKLSSFAYFLRRGIR